MPPVCTNPNITSGSVFGGQARDIELVFVDDEDADMPLINKD
jgi:hypothetical protein